MLGRGWRPLGLTDMTCPISCPWRLRPSRLFTLLKFQPQTPAKPAHLTLCTGPAVACRSSPASCAASGLAT